ncbi:MAG: hypothetical protein R6V10_02685 [bacterium]
MLEPKSPPIEKAYEDLKARYFSKKDEYLELCWRYDLPPRDMGLLLMGNKEIEPTDRIRLIRLIISLMDMEKMLGPDRISDFLFPSDESHYLNSAMFDLQLH